VNIGGVSGPVDFDEHGDVTGFVQRWHFESGKIVYEGNCFDRELNPCEVMLNLVEIR
jgi:hypothetical protein